MIETGIDPNVRIDVSINGHTYVVSDGQLRLLRRGIVPASLRFLGTSVREIKDRKFLVKSDGRFRMVDITLNGKQMVVSEDEYETLLSGIVPPHYEHQGGSPVVETSTDNFVVTDKNDKNDKQDDKNDKIDKKEIVMTTAPKGYEDLYGVLLETLEQTAQGKGKERHGNGKPFSEQPIMTIAAEHGVGFLTGQAAKKLGESHTLLNIKGRDAAVAELLGAIAYTAAAILHLRRTE